MQRSPFYANRIFDSKYDLSNLPTYSNSIVNIDKILDKSTGKITYKERKKTDNLYSLNDGSVRDLVKDTIDEKTNNVEKNVTKNVVNEISTIAPQVNSSMAFAGYLQEFIKNSNKDREYVFSPYLTRLMKYTNSKVYENAELLDTKSGFLLQVTSVQAFISGLIKNNAIPIEIGLRFRFLCKVNQKGKVLQIDTPFLQLEPTESPIFEFSNFPITKQLPDSDSILYAVVPSVVVRYDDEKTVDLDLSIRTRVSFRFEKV